MLRIAIFPLVLELSAEKCRKTRKRIEISEFLKKKSCLFLSPYNFWEFQASWPLLGDALKCQPQCMTWMFLVEGILQYWTFTISIFFFSKIETAYSAGITWRTSWKHLGEILKYKFWNNLRRNSWENLWRNSSSITGNISERIPE